MSRNPRNNKSAGNAWERNVAKDLSYWIFDDVNILKRHPSSGAEKSVYSGDLIPLGQMPDPWKYFPFHVECKVGYNDKSFITTAPEQILSWYYDAKEKVNAAKYEKHIWIIWKILNKGILFITDIPLGNWRSVDAGIDTPSPTILISKENLEVYSYNIIIKEYKFEDLFDIELEFN